MKLRKYCYILMATPVRRQYLQIKKQYPDIILFFRLGDFYETFDDDAELVAQICDIALTSRPIGKGKRVPLAGVPYHAAEGYITKLIQAGHKVAICEQMTAAPVKGLMPRDVVRVVTPGTVTEASLLNAKQNNYLAALFLDENRAGVSYVDITTGEFATTEISDTDIQRGLAEELYRLNPVECLSPPNMPLSLETPNELSLTEYAAWHFDLDTARQALLDHFKVSTLDGFGCAGKPAAICAAGAIVQYLTETQKGALPQLTHLNTYSTTEYMSLDATTIRNLELTEITRERTAKGSLLDILDKTHTPMGSRMLRQRVTQPLLNRARLEKRLDAVEAFYSETLLREELVSLLKNINDIERLTNRVVQQIALPRDLVSLRKSLAVVAELRTLHASTHNSPSLPILGELNPCEEVINLIQDAITEEPPATLNAGGVIAAGFSTELDNINLMAQKAKQWVANLEKSERKRTGIKSLKVGFNKVFGYYIEVTKVNTQLVPEEYVRKQTLVNAERYITPELKEYEAQILNAEERQQDLETQLFRQVCVQVSDFAARLLETARKVAELDVYVTLAEVAAQRNYIRPTLTDDYDINIVAARHPMVEVTQREVPFTPNSVRFAEDERILIITGPNMSGKSVYIKQSALIILMAQIGSFVPADRATIGIVDRIFTRIGAQDEIGAGQSTFMVEMVETANVLHNSTPRSLIILDEIGRGTSTYDGMAIARAVVEYIHNSPQLGAKTMFATHYHELVELQKYLPHVRNYNVAVMEEGDQVIFLHQIIPGGADKSYGVHVARLAGIPKAVINRAAEILDELENMEAVKEQKRRVRKLFSAQQTSFFDTEPSPAIETLKELRVDELSPLEALTKLYELKRMVEEEDAK